MSNEFRIINGLVFDPANGVEGKVCDILIKNGKIVSKVAKSAKVIDAKGMVVMPGGVDIHCHTVVKIDVRYYNRINSSSTIKSTQPSSISIRTQCSVGSGTD